MFGTFLLAFFIGMPAVVVFLKRKDMRHAVTRSLLTWGGSLAILLAAMVILPLLACEGSMISGYSGCIGGAGPSGIIAKANPLIVLAGKIYVLAGIPLAILIFALDSTRRA